MITRKVTTEWSRRVVAEYASASITAELLHWLIQIGVPPGFVTRCHGIVMDEIKHAALSKRVYEHCGGTADIPIHPRLLTISQMPGTPLLQRVLAVTADFYCCGETVASGIFQAMLDNATDPLVEQCLKKILKDESEHGEFGWDLLEFLRDLASEDEWASLRVLVPGFIERICKTYQGDVYHIQPEEARFGLLEGESYRLICQKSVELEIEPRFRLLGLLDA